MKKRFVSLAEVKVLLEKESKKRELSYEQRLALKHAQDFVKLNVEKTKKLIEKLKSMKSIWYDLRMNRKLQKLEK